MGRGGIQGENELPVGVSGAGRRVSRLVERMRSWAGGDSHLNRDRSPHIVKDSSSACKTEPLSCNHGGTGWSHTERVLSWIAHGVRMDMRCCGAGGFARLLATSSLEKSGAPRTGVEKDHDGRVHGRLKPNNLCTAAHVNGAADPPGLTSRGSLWPTSSHFETVAPDRKPKIPLGRSHEKIDVNDTITSSTTPSASRHVD